MSDSSHQSRDPAVSVQLVLELSPGPLPIGRLVGPDVTTSFSGWMQLLAAIEDALAIAS